MSKYAFTMERLTIRDFVAIYSATTTKDIAALLPIVDKARDGGIFDLPAKEFQPVMEAFAKEWAAYLQSLQGVQPDSITQLLKRALGED